MFQDFKKSVQQFAETLVKDKNIYHTNVSGDKLYELYLAECTKHKENEVYKTRGEADCTCCKQFIRNFGNLVIINDDFTITSIWDAPSITSPYDKIAKAMSKFVKSKGIANIFFTDTNKLGTNASLSHQEDGAIKTWQHLYFELPKSCVVSFSKNSKEAQQAPVRAEKEVFQRSITEITVDAITTVLELIDSKSLYRGDDYKAQLTSFLILKKEFETINKPAQDNWFWAKSHKSFVSKIRNTAIGTLLIDICEGLDLDKAVGKFEAIMAPSNYKRPKAIFTQKMIKDAENTINELGFGNSLGRRFATPADITVNNVIYVDRNTAPKMKGGLLSAIAGDAQDATINPKQLNKIEEMPIEDFISKIVPASTSIEYLLENGHESNLFSLIAPEDVTAPSMLKWSNNFSWTYNGNITDSMKELVKSAGGKVDGVLRFSISWNEDRKTESDYDAHCVDPTGHMYYGVRNRALSSGCILDVDIRSPNGKTAVENITYPALIKMPDGNYEFSVHCFSKRNGTGGFSAEIEFDGQILSFSHPSLRQSDRVVVARIRKTKNEFSVIESLNSIGVSNKNIWGLTTNTFNKVSMVTLSPNFWDENKNGNKHYMFMLDKCKNEGAPRGFFNEFLKEELTPHKRVFEALGAKMLVQPSDDQVSGVGFSSTQRNSAVFRVEGKYKRVIKVSF